MSDTKTVIIIILALALLYVTLADNETPKTPITFNYQKVPIINKTVEKTPSCPSNIAPAPIQNITYEASTYFRVAYFGNKTLEEINQLNHTCVKADSDTYCYIIEDIDVWINNEKKTFPASLWDQIEPPTTVCTYTNEEYKCVEATQI